MKRSEIMNEIIAILEEDTYPVYVDTDYHTISNTIVNYLERMAVLKPWEPE
jgi:hypothetical protein